MSREPRITEAPESIWLNYGEIERDCTHAECYRDGDVTWCAEPVFDSDVKYIRADTIAELTALRASNARLVEALKRSSEAMKHIGLNGIPIGGQEEFNAEHLMDMAHRCEALAAVEQEKKHE